MPKVNEITLPNVNKNYKKTDVNVNVDLNNSADNINMDDNIQSVSNRPKVVKIYRKKDKNS